MEKHKCREISPVDVSYAILGLEANSSVPVLATTLMIIIDGRNNNRLLRTFLNSSDQFPLRLILCLCLCFPSDD